MLFVSSFEKINWMPTVRQVSETLPTAFCEKFTNTYTIIDGNEIFIETPSDLHMQSLTWSQYKHHNTAKFLVACRLTNQIVVFVHFCQIFTLHWFLLHNNVKKVMLSSTFNNSPIVIHPQKTLILPCNI